MGPNQSVPAWWSSAVIYQVYPRSFMDGNGDGTGDLPGILSRLDYLEWLGIDAIWISPIYPSPMADFGYDVSDYVDVDPLFGTIDDFDRLLADAHRRDVRVILDFVPNHTSDRHHWFRSSRASRESPHRDWYIWSDPSADGGPPNNWMSYFGGPAWTFDESTGQYYLHNFAPQQPELNWRNPDVEAAVHEQLRFWLDRGIDGFRIDVIDRLIKDELLRDNPPNPAWSQGDDPTGRFLRVHSEQQPEVMYIVRRLRRLFDEYGGDRVIVGEIAYDAPLDRLVSYYGVPPYHGAAPDGMHLPFNFNLITLPWDAGRIKEHVDEYESACPDFAVPNYVLGNHDRPRIATQVGPEQSRIAAMLLLTLRGVPTLYYGDEIGLGNVPVPPDLIRDPMGKGTSVFNRDECRTPMRWEASFNAGFCPIDATPWLPIEMSTATCNVASQRSDEGSLLMLYRNLLELRRNSPALRYGRYEPLEAGPGVFAYVRRSAEEALLVLLNFLEHQVPVGGMPDGEGSLVLSTRSIPERTDKELSNIELRANEGAIYQIHLR